MLSRPNPKNLSLLRSMNMRGIWGPVSISTSSSYNYKNIVIFNNISNRAITMRNRQTFNHNVSKSKI